MNYGDYRDFADQCLEDNCDGVIIWDKKRNVSVCDTCGKIQE